jgi:drug/metabolite transporter (DMT)-like permease
LANAIGIGLSFVSAQIVSAYLFFHIPFTPYQWLGTALVFAGILCIALGR